MQRASGFELARASHNRHRPADTNQRGPALDGHQAPGLGIVRFRARLAREHPPPTLPPSTEQLGQIRDGASGTGRTIAVKASKTAGRQPIKKPDSKQRMPLLHAWDSPDFMITPAPTPFGPGLSDSIKVQPDEPSSLRPLAIKTFPPASMTMQGG